MLLQLLVACLAGQDPLPPYKIDVHVEARGRGFFVSGTTELPDEAIVRIDVFRGHSIEGEQYVSKAVRVASGKFELESAVFPDSVLPGQYVVRVRFDLAVQASEEISKHAHVTGRAAQAQAECPLQVGTFAEFQKARQQRAAELGKDLDGILEKFDAALELCRNRGSAKIPELRARLKTLRLDVRAIGERRDNEKVVDFHLGTAHLTEGAIERVSHTTMELIDELSRTLDKDAAAGMAKVAQAREAVGDWVREAKRKIKAFDGNPDRVADVAEELRQGVKLLVQVWTDLDAGMPLKEYRERMEHGRALAQERLQSMAHKADLFGYEAVEKVSAAVLELFDAMDRTPRDAGAVKAAWDKLRAELDQLTSR